MSQPNEITIRIASPLRFIDDDSESAEESGQESIHGLSIVRKKGKSLGSEGSPANSLSPNPSREHRMKPRNQPFELTIRGENTIINIQPAKGGKTHRESKKEKAEAEDDEMYSMINQTVREIFQEPDNEEIEKAIENVAQVAGKNKKFAMKGMWKSLSRSAKTRPLTQPDRDERYPSIVLLQDPPEEKPTEDQYRKMVTMDESSHQHSDRPKFEYRSKSTGSLTAIERKELNELSLEQHSISIEKDYLEKEKKSLEDERRGLEKGRLKLEKEKRTLERGKSFIFQDRQILRDKRQVVEDEKASQSENQNGESLYKKEQLCMAMEIQLLEDEKKIIDEEHDLLKREKEIIEKERNILGGEKSVLEEEKVIFGKERVVMEKQRSYADEIRYRDDERSGESIANCSDEVISEIEGVFEDTLRFCGEGRHRGRSRLGRGTPSDLSAFNPPCGMSSPYPVYIPVYSLPRAMPTQCRACTRPAVSTRRNKSIQTQTEDRRIESRGPEAQDPDLAGLPFGLLSGLFPRVVITSMKTFPEGADELKDNEKNAQITELPPDDVKPVSSTTGPSKTKRTTKSSFSKKKVDKASTLQLPLTDLTLKAGCPSDKTVSDDQDTEESGVHTLTSDFQPRDDFFPLSDETISVETLHFGNLDDFYGNESKTPPRQEKGSRPKKASDLPLTDVGHSMYEKLTQISLEVEEPPASVPHVPLAPPHAAPPSKVNVSLLFEDTVLQVAIPGSITLDIDASQGEYENNAEEVDDQGRSLVPRSELWHTGNRRQRPTGNGTCFSVKLKSTPAGDAENAEHTFNFRLPGKNGMKVELSPDERTGVQMRVSSSAPPIREVKVGTDDQVAGADSTPKPYKAQDLSPRTCALLDALKKQLDFTQSEASVISFGKKWARDYSASGHAVVKQLRSPRPNVGAKHKPRQDDVRTREYYCEACLATMRLYEDNFISVQNMVDKFEALSSAGI